MNYRIVMFARQGMEKVRTVEDIGSKSLRPGIGQTIDATSYARDVMSGCDEAGYEPLPDRSGGSRQQNAHPFKNKRV